MATIIGYDPVSGGGAVHAVVQKRRVNVCRCVVGPPFCVYDPSCCDPAAPPVMMAARLGVAPTPAPGPTAARRPLPCVHLGHEVERANSTCRRFDRRQCRKGHGVVWQGGACEGCGDYQARDGGDD
jgi:hypothetical protein